MTEELQKQLYAKYPAIFRQKDLSMQETCMCWGIECPDAWYFLLDALCRDITRLAKDFDFVFEATQVKEKYGTLRFYHKVEFGPRWTVHFLRARKVAEWFECLVPVHNKRLAWLRTFFTRTKFWFLRHGTWFDGHMRIPRTTAWSTWSGATMPAHEGINDAIDQAISRYEAYSRYVCADCGSTDDVQCGQGGWVTYRCAKCRDPKEEIAND